MHQNVSKEYTETYFMLKFMLNKTSVGTLFMPYLLLTCCAAYKINRMFLSLSPILVADPLKSIFFQWTTQISIYKF